MPKITHLLNIQAKPKTVLQAVNTGEGFQQWWTPAIDQEDGKYRLHFGPNYSKLFRLDTPTSAMESRWTCLEATSEWVGTQLIFRLEETETRTRLRFEHQGWGEYTAMMAQCSYDWAMFLRSLKSYCEKGKGQPYPDQGK